MGKIYRILVTSLLTATILCIFGQRIAYFLSKHVIGIHPIYYLTGLTILGWLLYLVSVFLIPRLFKHQNSAYTYFRELIMVLFITAPIAVIWSIFVVAMWWG